MKTIVITKKFWGAFSTVIVVGFLFAYYLMIYVPKKEGEITARKFRALQRAGENLSSMKEDYQEAIRQMLGEYITVVNKCLNKRKNKKSHKDYNECHSINKKYLDDRLKSLNVKLEQRLFEKDSTKYLSNEERITRPYDILFDFYSDSTKDNLYGVFPKVGILDFLGNQNLLENDFHKILIIRNFKIKSIGENRSDSIFSIIAYQKTKGFPISSDNKVDIADFKDLVENSFGLTSIPTREVKIGGTSYRLYGQRISFETDEDWVVCGLMKSSEFKNEARSVHLIVIIFSLLILLFLLLAMPILKLLVMSDIERLRISNVWFSGFAIVVGTTLIIYIFLGANHYFIYEESNDRALRALSDSVNHKFNLEVQSIQKQLIRSSKTETFEINEMLNGSNYKNKSNVLAKGALFKLADTVLTDPILKDSFKIYPFFNEMMWMDKKGDQKITYTTHPMSNVTKTPNLIKRDYFSKPLDGTFTSNNSPRFYLQSIFSWRSRLHEAGLGMQIEKNATLKVNEQEKSVKLEVMAMATKLHSVMDPLLPVGYQFCIISQQGEVLFHSNTDKNKQENLFSETENDDQLIAAVQGRLEKSISLSYGQSPQRLHIKPFKNMPFCLVTMHDRDHYKSPVVLAMGFGGVLVAILFLVQGLQILLLFITTYRSTKLKIKRFFMNWLRPIKVESNNSFHSNLTYFKSAFGMGFMSLILAIISYSSSKLYLVILFWLVPIIILLFNYLLLNELYKKQATGEPWKSSGFAITSVLLIVFIYWGAYSILPLTSFMTLLGAGALIAVFLFVIYFRPWVPRILTSRFQESSFNKLYVVFLLSWLVLVGVVPIFYFYKVSYYREMSVWTRYTQWQALQDKLQRTEHLKEELVALGLFNKKEKNLLKSYFNHSDKYGNYLNVTGKLLPVSIDPIKWPKLETKQIDSLEFLFRPPYKSGPMEKSRIALSQSSKNKDWLWQINSNRDTIALSSSSNQFFYSTIIPPYRIISKNYGLLFILGFVIIILVARRVIKVAVSRIFGLGLIDDCRPAEVLSDEILQDIKRSDNHKYRIFIVGLPFSGKGTLLKKIRVSLSDTEEISMRNFDVSEIGKLEEHKVFIVTHFEHGINDHSHNAVKSQLLQKLQGYSNTTIIISSAIQPTIIFDTYEAKIDRLSNEKPDDDKARNDIQTELKELRSAYRIWKNLLAGFQILYHPLDKDETVDDEIAYGNFLPKLKKNLEKQQVHGEDKILLVEEMAESYYHALWNSFSRDEKYLLYDLAKDRFVNMRNTMMIRMLMKKGVLVMKDSLRIMNKSFNNFILSVVKEDEEIAMTNELRAKGTWNTVQVVIVISLIAIITFIALAQQDILTNFNAIITTVAGVVGLFLRFGGLFTSGAKFKE